MPRTVIAPEKARQGRKGVRILIVLLCGLALAMLVWWGVEMFGRAIAPETPPETAPPATQEAPADTAPAPQQSQ